MKKFLNNINPIEIFVAVVLAMMIYSQVGCGIATVFAQPQGLVRTGEVFHPTEGYDLVRNEMKIDHVTPCQSCDHNRQSSKTRSDQARRQRQQDRDLRYQRRDRDH